MYAPGVALHVIQRGNDRTALFVDGEDFTRFRSLMALAAARYGVVVHAYVLMTNHVHLLVTPRQQGATSRMMQAIGRRYVGSFNARYQRTGTLREGRFKSALVDSERYALACYRYIELNPVRAGMAATARDYRWSSHGHNACGVHDPRINPHPAYSALGTTELERQQAYQRLFDDGLADSDANALRQATNQQKTWGSERFRLQIEALARRELQIRPRGRPKGAGTCT